MSRTYRALDRYLPDDPDAELLDREERLARIEGRFQDPHDDETLEVSDGRDRPF